MAMFRHRPWWPLRVVARPLPSSAAGGGTSAPTLSAPTVTSVTTTGATARITATGGSGGTLYWTVQLAGTDPSTAEVAAGQDGDGASLPAGQKGSQAYAGAGTINASTAASGLSAGTAYEVSWVWYDGSTYSNVTTGTFTTYQTIHLSSPTVTAITATTARGRVTATEYA